MVSRMNAAVVSLFLLFPHETVHAYSTWDYDHQDLWSETYPHCSEPDQSPIDIQTADVIVDPTICNSSFDWKIDLSHETFKLTNTGASLIMSPVQKADKASDWIDLEDSNGSYGTAYIYLNSNHNTIAKFPNYFKPDASIHDTFCFHSAHFHWGLTDATGSEHLVDGFQYPLEAHFVHYSCSHNNIGEVFEQFQTIQDYSDAVANGTDVRQLGVISIFYDVVDDTINPAFDTMFANDTLLQIVEPTDYDTSAIVNDLDLSALIPYDIYTAGYYAYEGSLTTPPCSNINRWHVMNARGYIHRSQLELFREIETYSNLNSSEADYMAPNYREVQHNDNNIYACMDVTVAPSSQPTKQPTDTIYMPPSEIPPKHGQFSWWSHDTKNHISIIWSAAIIASLCTVGVIGLCGYYRSIFLKTIRNETTQNKDHDGNETTAAPGATYGVDINEREEGGCELTEVTGSKFN